jgi:hypothetical protein
LQIITVKLQRLASNGFPVAHDPQPGDYLRCLAMKPEGQIDGFDAVIGFVVIP